MKGVKEEAFRDREFRANATKYLKQLEGKIKAQTIRLEKLIERVKAEARNKTDWYISGTARKCYRHSRCLVCLGKYPLHYPKFFKAPKQYVDEFNAGEFNRPRKMKGYVKKEDERDLLLSLGLSAEEVDELYFLKQTRHALIRLYHYTVLSLSHLGVLPEALGIFILEEPKAEVIRVLPSVFRVPSPLSRKPFSK